jgi:phosphatidylglycerol lysyltransferase
MSSSAPGPTRPAFDLIRRFGTDAVSFLAFESSMRLWFDVEAGGASEGVVAFNDTGTAWIAAGRPVAEASRVPQVAARFVQSARENGRRACFFATESGAIDGFARLLLGEQPVWEPAGWPAMLASHRRLREQIRRPRAKGVTVRRVEAYELEPGGPLRRRVESLAREWLATRRMVPMGFLVAVEPFHNAAEHRYFVAERHGQVVEFLSAVPVYARRGWLIEDVLRGPHVPNGTTEALIDAVMRDVADSEFVTLGLAPLTGAIPPWLRIARFVTSPFFDFDSLRRFRQRLRPSRWEAIWLLYPRSDAPWVAVIESLRAFAGGSLARFALRSFARGPSGPPWALALPLVPWTLLLAVLALAGRSDLVGFSRAALFAWVAFDALLTVQLMRSARQPRPGRLAVCAAAALVDAGVSIPHLVVGGFGRAFAPILLRGLGALAPCFGAAVLIWSAAKEILRSDA